MGNKNWILGLIFVVAVVVAVGIWGFNTSGSNKNDSNKDSSATANYFDENAKVMYFYSDTCHWCIQEKAVLEKLGDEGYRVKSMDVGNDTSLWTTYNISGTPTFIADSGKGERLVGHNDYDKLKAWLDQHK